MIALFSMLTSLISWGLSLIFSGLLDRECAQRVKGMDYRAAGAAAYLGLGAVWALGLSSSAAMMMATKGAIPPSLFAISGLIPLRQTLFLWQSMVTALVLIVVSVVIAYLSAPSAENARTAEDFGIDYESLDRKLEPRTKPGEWLEYSPLLTILVAAMLIWYLVDVFRTSPQGALAALDLNTYNLMFITAGLLLHWRPKRFVRAVAECVPATGGVLIQFPFYAVIFGMIVGTGISDWLANLFVAHHHARTLSAAGGVVLGHSGRLRSLRRKQVGHRGALRLAGRQPAPRAPGLGGADLQRRRGAAQPGQPVLDAAAAGHPEDEGARPGWLCRFADDLARPDRFLPVLAVCPVLPVHTADEVKDSAFAKGASGQLPLAPRFWIS